MEFGQSLSVAVFKKRHDLTKIKIIKNPKTNKLFFVGDDSSVRGMVAVKGYEPDPHITEVTLDDKTTALLLHSRPASVNEIAEL